MHTCLYKYLSRFLLFGSGDYAFSQVLRIYFIHVEGDLRHSANT